MKALVALSPVHAHRMHNRITRPHVVSLHGTEVALSIVELPDIKLPHCDPLHAQSVLVKIEAFSCNYRERARLLTAALARGRAAGLVVGSEFAGTVVDVGHGVTSLGVGDRVCGDGSVELGRSHPGLTTQRASAELQLHHADKLYRLPRGMSMAQGAAFSVGAQTAYSMVRRLQLPDSSPIAVTAATSNTSLFAIKALAARGHEVHAITSSPDAGDHLLRCGASRIHILPRDESCLSRLEKSLHAVDRHEFVAVLDPFSDVYLRKLLPFVRRFGSYATCGAFQQSPEMAPDAFFQSGLRIDEVFNLLIRKSICLIGNNLGTTADLAAAAADFIAGRLKIDVDTVACESSLDRFVDRSFISPGRRGKVVFAYADSGPHSPQALLPRMQEA